MSYDDEINNDELIDMDIEDIDDIEAEEDEHRELVAGISGWGISLVAHGLLAFALMGIYIMDQLENEPIPVQLTLLDPPPEVDEIKEPVDRTMEDVKIEIKIDEVVTEPQVTELDLPVEEMETEDPEVAEVEAPRGREEAVSTAEMAGQAAFMVIGPGGGASGPMGNRRGGGKRRAIGAGGGSPRSEAAVASALRWFKRHQSPDGSWDVDGYPDNCTDNPKCEPGRSHTNSEGDVACTAYALLCFLGAGYEHRTPNNYRKVVADGLEWLKDQAQPVNEGGVMFGGNKRLYHNAVATMALAEAYAMTLDPALKGVAQDAVDYLLQQQNPDPRDEGGYKLGWNYNRSASRNDASVSGWACMALKSAAAGGLNVGQGMMGAKKYLAEAWKDANPHWETIGSDGKTIFPYSWNPATKEASPAASANGQIPGDGRTVGVGALMAVFLGHMQGDVMLESMLNTIMAKQLPQGYPTNTYYMYYNTLTVFQAGGARWDVWNDRVRDMLIDAQRPSGDGCFDGSWDWEGTKFHGNDTGRLLSTAYCCLSLEVYYRYARLHDGKRRGL